MSTPTLQEFNPKLIPWQYKAIKEINSFDYSTGINEILFSGSVGSAKSINGAHILARHLIENPNSRALVVRRALKDLKRTFWQLFLKHLSDTPGIIKSYNKSEMKITLINGSECIGDSYDDMNLEKFRSLELSFALIEEATESDRELYDAIKMRVGRLPNIKRNVILAITNPDSPSHYLYEYFIENQSKNRKVIYSLTEQNPFLPKWYIENLKNDLDPKMAQRMLEGKWVEIAEEVIYWNFNLEKNYMDLSYKFDPRYPIDFMHDFNIGHNKPMSMAIGQCINGLYHVAKTILIEGASTSNIMDELADTGILDLQCPSFRVFGDATGKHRDTRNFRSDYDIIKQCLTSHKRKDGRAMNVLFEVPTSNPHIRERHNLMNALFLNANSQTRFYIYKDAFDATKGFRLTKYKQGARLIEDDSTPKEQHVTTAIGYWCYRLETVKPIKKVVIS
jgi:hypothetical protein